MLCNHTSYILYLLNNLTKKFRNTFNKFLISNNLVYDLVCNTSYILLNHFPEKFRTAIGGFFIYSLFEWHVFSLRFWQSGTSKTNSVKRAYGWFSSKQFAVSKQDKLPILDLSDHFLKSRCGSNLRHRLLNWDSLKQYDIIWVSLKFW